MLPKKQLLQLQTLDWDSEHLDKPVYRLTFSKEAMEPQAAQACRAQLAALLRELPPSMVYCRLPASCGVGAELLRESQFQQVDEIVTFSAPAGYDSPGAPSLAVRQAAAADAAALQAALFQDCFRDGRFYQDPHIEPARAARIYQAWIMNCALEQAERTTFLVENAAGIAGFVSCRTVQGMRPAGQIELIAVHPGQRRQGIGKLLLKQAFSYFRDRGMAEIQVGTQASNHAAIQLYQAFGFQPESRQLSFHWHKPKGGS